MNNYPKAEDYEIMYARYFNKRSIHELIKQVPTVNGKKVLDICCGGGDLTIEVAKMGAKFTVGVDSSSKMIKGLIDKITELNLYYPSTSHVHPANVNIRTKLNGNYLGMYDCVFCRQAVNYWLTKKTSEMLAKHVVDGGYFVFNTFNMLPIEGISYKPYTYDGRSYIEVNQRIGNMIHHTQHCEGFPPHHTNFRWISGEEFHDMLDPHFKRVTEIVDGKTSIYVCEK